MHNSELALVERQRFAVGRAQQEPLRLREWQLRLSRFAPFVESVRRNQAAPFGEGLPAIPSSSAASRKDRSEENASHPIG